MTLERQAPRPLQSNPPIHPPADPPTTAYPRDYFFPGAFKSTALNALPLIFFISNHTLALTPISPLPQQTNTIHGTRGEVPFGSNFIIRFGTAVRGRTSV